MGWDHLALERDGDVAVLRIDRPQRRNALHAPLWTALAEVGVQLAQDPPRAVILTGAGEHFCAGMDLRPDNPLLQRVGAALMADDAEGLAGIINELKATFNGLASLPCPVIAAIEGACLGGGLELALTADIRVGSAGSTYSLPETRWGMVPDVGGTVRLTRLVGPGRAQDLILTGRTIDADEAMAWGLITHRVDTGQALARAETLANQIVRAAPSATRAALAVARRVPGLSTDRAFAEETQAGVTALQSREVLEGMAAFAQRRDPRWTR